MRDPSFVMLQDEADLQLSDFGQTTDLAERTTVFGIIEKRSRALLETALRRHREPCDTPARITLIIEPAQPPTDIRREELPILSFLASPTLFGLAGLAARPPATWCYATLRYALSRPTAAIDVQVVHKQERFIPRARNESCEAVISHRGPERWLRLCIAHLRRQSHPVAIQVGIDQSYRCDRFLADIAGDPSIRAFQLSPHPVGPFVALHVLSHRSQADYMLRQDSDDVAFPSRVATLLDAAIGQNAGFVGSHELQINEVKQAVIPVRYPLDINNALRRYGCSSQALLPLSLTRRDVFEAVGGFSTFRTFGVDTDFWLAASFFTRAINVDEFLYIRRRHARSLTMRPDIGLGSPVREAIRNRRKRDFAGILAGNLAYEESSLALRHRAGPVEFTDLATGVSESVYPGDYGSPAFIGRKATVGPSDARLDACETAKV